MRPRHVLSAAAAAALVLTACQTSASPSASPSEAESSGSIPSIGPFPSMVGNPELEATLPTEAAGIVFFLRESMSGPDFLDAEIEETFIDFIERLGADIEDVSVAVAVGANSDGTNTATILAFEVLGAEPDELVDAFKASASDAADPLEWRADTIGGKAVEVAEPNAEFPTPFALYAVGDVLYFVSSTSDQAFEEILRGLP